MSLDDMLFSSRVFFLTLNTKPNAPEPSFLIIINLVDYCSFINIILYLVI